MNRISYKLNILWVKIRFKFWLFSFTLLLCHLIFTHSMSALINPLGSNTQIKILINIIEVTLSDIRKLAAKRQGLKLLLMKYIFGQFGNQNRIKPKIIWKFQDESVISKTHIPLMLFFKLRKFISIIMCTKNGET